MKILRFAFVISVLIAPVFAQQFNQDIVPASTGLSLGHTNQRWNANISSLDINGTCNLNGQPCFAQVAPGGGAVATCVYPGGIAYYLTPGTTVSCPVNAVMDATGNATLNSVTIPGASTGVLSLRVGIAPGAPATGLGSLYIDSGTNTLKCLLSSGGNCQPSGSPGGSNTQVQFNGSGVFAGDSNLTWDNTNKGMTVGPTTNIGYLPLINTPRIYVEAQQNGLVGNTTNAFTNTVDFRSFLNPAGGSSIENFTLNSMAVVQSVSTQNFSNEIAGAHCEGDNNGTGTINALVGCAGEAFSFNTGTVAQLLGMEGNVGTLSAFTIGTPAITTSTSFLAQTFAESGTITNGYGLHVTAVNTLGCVGTCITNFTGLQIENSTVSGVGTFLAMNITGGQNNLGPGLTQAGTLNVTTAGGAGAPAQYFGTTSGGSGPIGFHVTGSGSTGALFASGNGVDLTATDVAFGVTALGAGGFGISATTLGSRDVSMNRRGAGILGIGSGGLTSTAGTVQVSRLLSGSLTPTCTFTSGGGSVPSCTLGTGSTDSSGTIIATTGTGSPAGTGTITLTFSSGTTFAPHQATCIYMASDGGAGAWQGLAVMKDKTPATANDLFTWTNGTTPTTLNTSTAYWINYQCWAN